MTNLTPRRLVTTLCAVLAVLGAVGAGAAISATSLSSPTITSAPAALTSSRSATFTFTGPSGSSFLCSLDGSTAAACNSPRNHSSLADGSHTFSVTAVKGADRSSATFYRWTVDATPPPAPTLTQKPSDPTLDSENDFAWTDTESGVTFECSLDNGAWASCSSPYTWTITDTNYGQRQFAVRAKDAAGNPSAAASYKFNNQKRTPFQVTGSPSAPLVIGIEQSFPLTVTNPNPVAIKVSQLTVRVATVAATKTTPSAPRACRADDFRVIQPGVSASNLLTVPANGSVAVQAADRPKLLLINKPENQDGCKSVSLSLSYSGTASN